MQKLKTEVPLYIYLHTHWDREWFLTFSTARALLLDRVKRTMSAIESDQLPNFYLDGQAIVLEDLIEIEPNLSEPIKKAMKRGKLSAGPWYVLPDQSLVGGESLVRNLKLGIEITRRFGPPTMTGYNPDTFCHVQDLPRILKGFDIDTALVLRGVPALPDTNVFWWQSPDGSRVLTYWLNKGLSHPIFHKTTDEQEIAKDLLGRWDLEAADQTKAPMLYSAGGEGMQPPGGIQAKIQKLNAILPKHCKAKVISMEEFLIDLKRWAEGKSLPVISGDLRDNRSISERFPAYILDGVSSTRLYLKRDNALAEHRLARITEPLLALLHSIGAMPYPENELIHVWKLLIQNHPHDSICGCSIDPVHQEMRTRTQQFNTFLDGVDLLTAERVNEWDGEIENTRNKENGEQALPAQAGPQPIDPDNGNDRLLVFNTSGYSQQMPVRMTWYSQPTAKVLFAPDHVQIENEVVETNHLYHSGGGFYYKPVRRIDGWIWPDAEIPGMGLSQIQWRGLSDKSSHTGPDFKAQRSQAISDAQVVKAQKSVAIENGLIRATIDTHGDLVVSSFADEEKEEINIGHHLVDVGDGGDTYNFDPLAKDSELKAKLVKVSEGKKGPLVSSMMLEYSLAIPEGLENDSLDPPSLESRRVKKSIEHKILTEVSLKKGVPILFFDTTFENFSRDHRLSVRFSTGQPLKESIAEAHFSVAKHPVRTDKPKLPVPVGCEILPESEFCQRFFLAAGQLFLNRGLPEYRAGNDFVEITLLRAVSYLSRGRLRTRGGGAGPWEATPEANCFGTSRCEYAWSFLTGTEADEEGDEQIVEAYRLADLFEGRLVPFPVGKFTESGQQSLVEISNPALYITATYVDRGKLYVRLLNVTSSAQNASVTFRLPVRSVAKTNLLGDEISALALKKESGSAKEMDLSLGPNELVTLAVDLH